MDKGRESMKVVFIFIDGFGLGENDVEKNPMVSAQMPFMRSLFEGQPLTADLKGFQSDLFSLAVTDVNLGIPGIPQSATGQTSILTGKNASKIEGRHVNACPTKKLREVLASSNIYKQLLDLGFAVTFANAYNPYYLELAQKNKIKHSATTIAALAAGLRLRTLDDLLQGDAVYQDITNELLVEWGYDVPIVSPELAGERLAKLALDYDFCLFEYFQSDRAGHKQNRIRSEQVLNLLDRFIESVYRNTNLEQSLIIVTSDHGNIEDLTIKTHTNNFVPTFLIGKNHSIICRKIKSLTDITPAIIDLLKGELV